MIRSILCLWILSAFGYADEETQEPVPVDMRFLFLDESGTSYFVIKDHELQKITSYPYAISSPVQALSGTVTGIYKELPPLPAGEPPRINPQTGKPLPRVLKIAEVTYPGDTPAVLAVLRRDRSGEFQVSYFESDPEKFPAGSVRVLNLGLSTFGVKMNEKMTKVPPNSAQTIIPIPDARHRIETRVVEQTPNGNWQPFYKGVTVLRPGQRVNAVLVYSPSGMKHTLTKGEIQAYGAPPGHAWLVYTDRPQ
ncbi:hypothetical protein P0Y35_07040 [Kiritimatiellaeota bacterium B1221]|nr:hypothetical protein [Kiritimatiellaeota bacterium B1221]